MAAKRIGFCCARHAYFIVESAMTPGRNTKRKSAHCNKDGPRIAEWTIEQATAPGHVRVSFVVMQGLDDGASRPTTRHFLLRCERATELIDALKEALEESTTIQGLEAQAAAAGLTRSARSGVPTAGVEADDAEVESNHFALGAYGLVGN